MVGGSLTSSACATGSASNETLVKTTGASASNRWTMFPPGIFAVRKLFLLFEHGIAGWRWQRRSAYRGVCQPREPDRLSRQGGQDERRRRRDHVSRIASTCPSATTSSILTSMDLSLPAAGEATG